MRCDRTPPLADEGVVTDDEIARYTIHCAVGGAGLVPRVPAASAIVIGPQATLTVVVSEAVLDVQLAAFEAGLIGGVEDDRVVRDAHVDAVARERAHLVDVDKTAALNQGVFTKVGEDAPVTCAGARIG